MNKDIIIYDKYTKEIIALIPLDAIAETILNNQFKAELIDRDASCIICKDGAIYRKKENNCKDKIIDIEEYKRRRI